MTSAPLCSGIDRAKDHLDVARSTGEHTRVPHDAPRLTQLITGLPDCQPTLIALEASGGHERTILAALEAADLPVALVNPTGRGASGSARAT